MKATVVLMIVALQWLRLSLATRRTYLDPGSGSMLLQLLLGGVAGVAVMLRIFWQQFSGFFRFGKRDTTDDSK
jgi:hypothetical protein